MSETKTPEGWALVPINPTQSMVNAAKDIDGRLSVWKWADGYAEMLKAAPTTPADHIGDANKKVAALELSLKAKTEQLAALHKQQDAAREAIASLESERAANAILTAEIEVLRAQQRQDCEPVAWWLHGTDHAEFQRHGYHDGPEWMPLYAAPPKRETLSDDEMWSLWNSFGTDDMSKSDAIAFARAIERAHGIGGQS